MGLSQRQFHIALNALYMQPEMVKIINRSVITYLDSQNLIRGDGSLTARGKQTLHALNQVKMKLNARRNPRRKKRKK